MTLYELALGVLLPACALGLEQSLQYYTSGISLWFNVLMQIVLVVILIRGLIR